MQYFFLFLAIFLIGVPTCFSKSYGSFEDVVFHGCYDGESCTFTIPGGHPLLGEKIKVRIRGIDTAKIRSNCKWEVDLAKKTRGFLTALLKESPRVDLIDLERSKTFKIVATVIAHGVDIGKVLIDKGWAKPYQGGKREGWCSD